MKKQYLFLISCIIFPLMAYCFSMNDLFSLTPEKIKNIPIKDIWVIITCLIPIAKIIVRLTKSKEDDKKLNIILKALSEFLPLKEREV